MSENTKTKEAKLETSKEITVDSKKLRPEGYEGSCLRPIGLCDLGGCCDICWYNPEHPRFKKKEAANS